VKAKYEKRELHITMRDGVKLFTSVYAPRDTTRRYPILMTRTPYGGGPYGADSYRASLGSNQRYMDEGFHLRLPGRAEDVVTSRFSGTAANASYRNKANPREALASRGSVVHLNRF